MSSDPREASVHSWDVSTGVDGPGTRFVLFLSGCPLRCLYCQNPDTWHMRDGRRMHLDAIMAELRRYQRFLRVARGGVTVSGGEPLLQSEFVTEFFGECKSGGLTTALDTSGHLGVRADDTLLGVTDLVLLDIKSFDPGTYHRLTGKEVQPTLDFARRLADFIAGLGPAVERVEIIPFHRLGAHKYEALRMRFPLEDTPTPDAELIERTRSQFAERQLPVLSA